MAGAFARSWEVTKVTFSVIKQDKEMLLFPILSGIFSLIFMVLLLFPMLFSLFLGEGFVGTAAEYVLIFVTYLGLSIISTFFGVCTVYTATQRFAGNNATFSDSMNFAFSRFSKILAWGLVSATVGLLLNLLSRLAQNAKGAGKIILSIVSSLVGMAWSIATVFVVPVLVYENIGPFAALKKSVSALKKTWGENLIAYVGLGLAQFVFMILGIIVFAVLALFLASISATLAITIAVLGVLYVVGVILVFHVAKSVFNAALYTYANSGSVPGDFNKELIENAFQNKA